MENTTKSTNNIGSENLKTTNSGAGGAGIKNAIIVGASSGIGLATAELMLSNGYEVINISRTPCDTVTTVLADVSKKGKLASAINTAVQDIAASVTAGNRVTSVTAAGGNTTAASQNPLDAISAEGTAVDNTAVNKKLDVLVYSAGCSMASPIEFADPSDYRYLFEVNFFGAIEAIKSVLPYMKEKGGRIVLISSMGGTFPIAFDAFYSASKAAIDMLAEAADLELKPYGIRVCSVRPGGVATKFTYKRNIYGSAAVGDYADKQKRAVASLAQIEQDGLTASAVAEAVYTVINMPSPPVKLAVGLKNKVYCAAARLLPDRLISFFNAAKYEQ